MHPLLTGLACWPGRSATKSLLEAKGYWLPERFREIMLTNCGCSDEAALDRYWDETALEYLCSAGRVRSNDRIFSGETAYRSEYLDGLASSMTKRGIASPVISLHEDLRTFKIKANEPGSKTWPPIADEMEKCKIPEIENFAISAAEWSGTKGDLSKCLNKTAESRGFAFKKKRWRKDYGALELRCYIDAGMRSTWTFQLVFEIEHKLAPDLVFSTWLLEPLMPGFHYYHRYESPEVAILGIQAHVDLLDAIGQLTTTQPRSTAASP
ncbi:MAG: hypothetical protein ACKVP3_01055 [Hyphomicrobiaceae bacterium]